MKYMLRRIKGKDVVAVESFGQYIFIDKGVFYCAFSKDLKNDVEFLDWNAWTDDSLTNVRSFLNAMSKLITLKKKKEKK